MGELKIKIVFVRSLWSLWFDPVRLNVARQNEIHHKEHKEHKDHKGYTKINLEFKLRFSCYLLY
jgi:hypothetical protein